MLSSALVASTLFCGVACRKPPAAAAAAQSAQPGQPAQPGTVPAPAAPAAAKPMPAELPAVLARVNGEAVTKVDFDRLIKNMELSAKEPIPAERRDEIFRNALDQLVTYTVLTQATRARNVTIPDAEIDGNIKQMQSQFATEEGFKKALAARGMTLEKLRSDARTEMCINKMMETEVSGQAPATDVQVREFYDTNPDKFKQPEAVRASHILFAVDEKADEATKQKILTKAQGVLKEARGGADFAQLARQHSADGSAAQGGDLNFFPRGQMVGPFDQAAFSMKPGEISDLVTTQFGYHIIKLTERRPASTVAFEQVAPRVKEYLTEQQKQARAQAFIVSLKQKAKIEVLV